MKQGSRPEELFDELNSIISAENWRMQQKFPLFVPFLLSKGVNKPRIFSRSVLIERLQRSALSRRASQIIGDFSHSVCLQARSSPPRRKSFVPLASLLRAVLPLPFLFTKFTSGELINNRQKVMFRYLSTVRKGGNHGSLRRKKIVSQVEFN
jgi:hypothetical protein